MFVGTCTAAVAGSQSVLDPESSFFKAPVPAKGSRPQQQSHTPIAPSTLEEAETTTTTQYVKMPGVETPSVKPEKKTKVAAKGSNGPGLISGVDDKFKSAGSGIKSAGSGIVGGTKSASGQVVKGAKAAGEGIASSTKKVGDGIANGSKKVSGGIASGAKASGAFFAKGAHVMGSGFKAATASIPGFGHGKKTPKQEVIISRNIVEPSKEQQDLAAADKPLGAQPVAQTQPQPANPKVAQVKPEKAQKLPELKREKVKNPDNQLVHEKVKKLPSDELVHEKVKKLPGDELAASPGIVGKTMNKLTFWKHKQNGPSVQATASKDDPAKIVR